MVLRQKIDIKNRPENGLDMAALYLNRKLGIMEAHFPHKFLCWISSTIELGL